MNSLSESAVLLGRDLVDRVWDIKAELERRVADMSSDKKDEKVKCKFN